MTEDNPESPKERIAANIRRTVGIAALRKIRKLVDETDAEKQVEHKALIGVAVMLFLLIVLGVYLTVQSSFYNP
jgi:cell division protein FtsX